MQTFFWESDVKMTSKELVWLRTEDLGLVCFGQIHLSSTLVWKPCKIWWEPCDSGGSSVASLQAASLVPASPETPVQRAVVEVKALHSCLLFSHAGNINVLWNMLLRNLFNVVYYSWDRLWLQAHQSTVRCVQLVVRRFFGFLSFFIFFLPFLYN